MFKSFFCLTTATLLLTSFSNVSANTSVEQIKTRANEINDLKSLILSSDPATKLAAIDTMQNSEDLAMKELSFYTGLKSPDESIVALSIRNRFSEIDSFVVLMTKPNEGDAAQKVYDGFGGKVLFNIKSYDKSRATFVNATHRDTRQYDSTISGLNLFLNSYNCKGAFRLVENLSYKGTISCNKKEFPAVINLF